jgi:hypothetical protein
MPNIDRTPKIISDRHHFHWQLRRTDHQGQGQALLRLWREKRGEEAPIDLSGILIVQLGLATEGLYRRWYELKFGHRISDVQRHAVHRTMPWMAATLDGLVKKNGAVFEAKFMMPWSFSEEAAAEKYMTQLQHNMLVAGTKKSVLSNGGGKWIELSIDADPIYQTILIAAERSFWRSVKTGEPRLYSISSLRNHGSKQFAWSTSSPTKRGSSVKMAKKTERPAPHPDDFMIVAVSLAFQAKLNPEVDDPPPFDAIEIEETFKAADAADHLEKLVTAIRERRLFGFMLQEQAESAVGAGQWIEKTNEEIFAQATAENVGVKLPNVQRIKLRHDD